MAHRRELVREIRPHVALYRDPKTGIAWVEDGTSGTGHSAHPNIHYTGSVAGMKNPRHVSGRGAAWGKNDRTVRSHGWIYNIDQSAVSGELDKIACEACRCGGAHHCGNGARHGDYAPRAPGYARAIQVASAKAQRRAAREQVALTKIQDKTARRAARDLVASARRRSRRA